jgi:hypothetical protein
MGRLRAGLLFPVGSKVTVKGLHVGTLAAMGEKGTVVTEPYQWFTGPGAGPRQCVVVDFEGLCKQVRTRDLKADPIPYKGGLPCPTS